uniref:Gly-zipper_YMGG domain-containing protein n=1 Tax=Macrostomum lignano TaxID=282301 RepID=A0A1I8JMV2_9PLAT
FKRVGKVFKIARRPKAAKVIANSADDVGKVAKKSKSFSTARSLLIGGTVGAVKAVGRRVGRVFGRGKKAPKAAADIAQSAEKVGKTAKKRPQCDKNSRNQCWHWNACRRYHWCWQFGLHK